MASKFLSPGVFTAEQDFTVFASRVGLTRLGLVGKTQKGPAFEPIKIETTDDFLLRFGNTDPDLALPYVAQTFLSQSNELNVTRILGSTGFENSGAWLITAGSGSTNSGATLAVLRSKRNQISGDFYFNQESDVTIANITGPLNAFTLSATTGPLTAETNSGITVSLDETSQDYIVNKLTKNPEIIDGDVHLYVEKIFPHYLREAVARGEVSDLDPQLVYTTDPAYTDYNDSYTNAITPWVVSRVVGSDVKNLFRVQTISDGDSSNTEIKISIQNLDVTNNRFDLLVRRFSDTDATASSSALERFTNLSMNEADTNFIGRAIGTTNEEYPRQSNFITVDIATSYPDNSIPAGFRGYDQRSTGVSGSAAADIYYKTTYLSGDSIFRTYMGISELAYTSLTSDQISFRNAVKTVESDLFQYNGGVSSGITTTKGFHMENTADSNSFVSGEFNSLTGYTNEAGTLIDRNKLKFTLVPAGGFDGFDKYATFENTYEEFTAAYADNVNQFKAAIDTFENVEEVDINVFATPGIDYSNNLPLVKHALEMVETRFDSLYVIDAPRLTAGEVKGTPEEAVAILESTGIDSSYACTYWPWIQINDVNNNKYTWQSPTLMAVESFAFTDNVANPWFAPAGMNRGRANSIVVRGDIKPNKESRDVLYQGRINPIATFIQEGVVIFGQKTLQVNASALDRINVRRLLLQVRRLIAAASLTLVFEQNDQTLRDQFLSRVEPILLNIQNQRGLTGFNVVMDDTNNTPETIDRNTLVGKIQLKPTPTAEFIDLTFQVLPTGANFEDF